MAQKQKRPSPLDDPPTASSSDSEDDQQPSSQQQDEEEVASSEEEEASSEEEERNQPSSKNPIPPPTTNSHPKPSSSDESATESDSGSDTDSDPGTRAPPAKVKPIASKPMDQTPKARGQAQAQPSPVPTRSGTKRAVESNANANDPKRAKKKANDASASASAAADGGGSDEELEEDGKKSGDDSKKLFQRLWSEEDEIAILKGLAEFTSKTGNDPFKYANEFHDFVKKSLHVDASSNQLKQKIRRLKKKFENHARKGKNGAGPNFSKSHDQKAFDLSKKVWAKESVEKEKEKEKDNGKPPKTPKKEGSSSRSAAASAKKSKLEMTKLEPELPPVELKESEKMETDEKCDTSLLLSEMIRFEKGVGLCGLNEDVVKRGVELIGDSKREELEGKWKKLQVAELELFVKRTQLIEEQARSILEAYKSSKH